MTPTPLRELAALFLRLGATAFGGPAAHVALMDDEVVRRRKWLSREEFLDLVGLTQLIPGPNSTELAMHVGMRRAGFPGLLVAGACFIAPAALAAGLLAVAYARYGTLPEAGAILSGVKPVVVAVIAQALWSLGATAVRTRWLAALGIAAAVAAAAGAPELAVLAAAGAVSLLASRISRPTPPSPETRTEATGAAVALLAQAQGGGDAGRAGASLARDTVATVGVGGAAAGVAASPSLAAVFGVFVKLGAVVFGSGYVLVAFLRAELVERLGWLTEAQLLDAVAAGQVTPGPVFTTATFIGYLLAGVGGAAVATVGIFLPGLVLVALTGRYVAGLRRSPAAAAVLDGVNVASLALMGVAGWHLARAAVVDAATLAIAAVSAVLLLRWRVNSVWLIAGGAAAGLALQALRG